MDKNPHGNPGPSLPANTLKEVEASGTVEVSKVIIKLKPSSTPDQIDRLFFLVT